MDLDLSFENSDDTDSIQAVLPLTTRDREFFNKLNKFMDDELLKLNRKHENDASKERFAIFKLAFEKAINKTTLYRRLFRSIKHEYERCINALELGAAEVSNMRNELHRLVLEPKTYLLRQKRCMELEDKLSIIETDNKRLEDEINQINDEQVTETYRTVDTTEDVQKTGHRRVPGLTFEQETDMQALEEYYQFLKEKLHRLQQNATTKYQSRQKKIDLQVRLEQNLPF
ncbi:unnamed protein product [Didymodactylos carnosus]|uniref:Translin-associated factor X-interacting protein 1 N-terminal domain-containing protein n=1 Tax=Didymodactylos carnosus TaxID=1234261 RepID=A0A8S2GHM3_9BILA|nr:unnamed protein product [Didymodactylos carnosus]CAF3519397.1 unnamed protein product [Didymodactylos carnosus]